MKPIQVPIHNVQGQSVGTLDLSPAVFGVSFNDPLVHQVVQVQMANRRQVLAHTKGRGEVRGGGKKPWKQKGTGRARHSSRRSPLWIGGGITFGPTKERNFSMKVNKQMRQQALRMVLSDKAANAKLVIVDEIKPSDAKTKNLKNMLSKLPSAEKKIMLVTEPADKQVLLAARNLPNVACIGVGSLNVIDVLKKEYLVVPKKLIPVIEKHYGV